MFIFEESGMMVLLTLGGVLSRSCRGLLCTAEPRLSLPGRVAGPPVSAGSRAGRAWTGVEPGELLSSALLVGTCCNIHCEGRNIANHLSRDINDHTSRIKGSD